MKRLILLAAFASVSALWLFGGAATASSGTVIYDSTVSPLPGNVPSLGFEATSTSEFGDAVTFAGTARNLKSVTVTMSSWGCETGGWTTGDCATTPGATFNVPITLNIYAAGSPIPGVLIGSRTQTFAIPYRPSADNIHCTGTDAGKWYDGTTCYNGFAYNITFDFSSSSVTLPNSIVYGIAFNTSDYGANPIGPSAPCHATPQGCGYDSLNVALSPSVNVGNQAIPGTAYLSSTWAGAYCDAGAAGTGSFRLDSPSSTCWGGYIPAVQFTATGVATTADQCKKDGWVNLTTAGGAPFKNQGDCVSYVASKGKAKGNP